MSHYLDEKFSVFKNSPLETKLQSFKRDDKVFDLVFSEQLDRPFIDGIYHTTNALRRISKSKEGRVFLQKLLAHKRAMLYFNQPSSRTFLSFENACHILGMKTSEIRDTNVSSEVKGESFDDSFRTFSSYANLIIMRSKGKDHAERGAWLLNTYSNRPVPVINGGSGSDQHPTQAILDIYTLQRSFADVGGIDGKTILMCGDLKRGRTVRSLSLLMNNFERMKLIFVAPKPFQMKDDVLDFLKRHNIEYMKEQESLKKVLPLADAIYMTRIQDEHDLEAGESAQFDMEEFKLNYSDLSQLKDHAAILHPFPRRDEIDVRIDEDRRAKYWRQERNGMWTRAALIATIFQVEQEILRYEKEHQL